MRMLRSSSGKAIEGKNVGGSLVPGKDIPPPARDVSRLIEGLDQASKGCGNDFPGEGAPIGPRCQRAQMRMLDFTEAQRSRQCVNRGDRRTDGPSLFQPDVPIDADPGQFGDFLAPQAGSSTSSPVGKANRFGVEFGAPRTKEVTELASAGVWHGLVSRMQVLTILG